MEIQKHALNSDRMTLVGLSCIHWPLTDRTLLDAFIGRVHEDPLARVILLGDQGDQDRTTRRKHRKSYIADDTSILSHDDRQNMRDVEGLAYMLSPIRDKILGVLEGNHFFQYQNGLTSDQYLCRLLKVPFVGAMGVFEVELRAGKTRKPLVVWAHHTGGSSGGRTAGASLNALLRCETAWDADIYAVGHDHRRMVHRESVMDVRDGRVVERSKVFVRGGTLMKAFDDKPVSANQHYAPHYSVKSSYRGTDLGWPEIGVVLRENPARFRYDLRLPDVV